MRISDWSSDVCSSDLTERLSSDAGPMTVRRLGRRSCRADRRQQPGDRRLDRTVVDDGADIGPGDGELARPGEAPLALRGTLPHRTRVVSGKRVSVRGDPGGRRILKNKKQTKQQ